VLNNWNRRLFALHVAGIRRIQHSSPGLNRVCGAVCQRPRLRGDEAKAEPSSARANCCDQLALPLGIAVREFEQAANRNSVHAPRSGEGGVSWSYSSTQLGGAKPKENSVVGVDRAPGIEPATLGLGILEEAIQCFPMRHKPLFFLSLTNPSQSIDRTRYQAFPNLLSKLCPKISRTVSRRSTAALTTC
jgi:hypothetical protein